MKKVLLATEKPFSKEASDEIVKIGKNAGLDVVLLEKYSSKDELLNAVSDVNAMIIRSDVADREVIECGKNLEIIVRAGAGYDNIDLKVATEKNIIAMNTPGQNSNAVAELAFGMMVMVARGNYDGKTGTELREKNLGLHAYGNVGKYMAKIAKGFGMNVFAFDPFLKDEQIEVDGITPVHSVEELYEKCQYISLHIPANEKTKKSINYSLISSMPANAVLVNTARKEVIDEEGLLKVMAERKDVKYVSDIIPDNFNLFEENFKGRFFFTPKKMGAQTEEANVNAGVAAINQIIDFFEKGDIKYKVN
ncbi:MAG: 3-phosphoglycerate dehydrogenase [Bacteroidales bacterium]|jgi:D-3-phosphoglycerate dehydrogenase|nr:3-phosphoglycerate dehydrogenase [Bacteroidales bacterium]